MLWRYIAFSDTADTLLSCGMVDTTETIDLTQSPPESRPAVRRKGARITAEAAVDLTSDTEDAAVACVDPHRQSHHDGSCCSTGPAASPADAPGPSSAATPEPAHSKGKRKRASPQDKEQARQKKLQAKAEQQAADKRVDAHGKTVRWTTRAPQKTRERIARAMPSMSYYSHHCCCLECNPSSKAAFQCYWT